MKLPVKINTVVERDFNNWIYGVLVTSVFFFYQTGHLINIKLSLISNLKKCKHKILYTLSKFKI